ncbi:MAG: hypothetical protein ACN0LA_14865 [Candidatus Longimicrobiales bacterium M2_2A_002]
MRRGAVLLLALWPTVGLAQSVERSLPAEPADLRPDLLRTPAGAFASSLILPGAGQAALGLKRWAIYGLAELTLWGVHLEAAADVRRLTDRYRDLAWESARLPAGSAERAEGSWGYYETLGQYLRSGAFDADPSASDVQPETDPATYNGYIWELARGIFLPGGTLDPSSPAYGDAVAYYRDHAAGPNFLWDWSGRLDDLDRYRTLIDDADGEARVRSTALGLVLANHLVSAVDALLVARLRAAGGARIDSRLTTTAGDLRWHIGLRIPVRNR